MRTGRLYKAETDAELVRYFIASVLGDMGEVDSIYVRSAHRKLGIGGALM